MKTFRNREPLKLYLRIILASAVTLLVGAVGFYFTLPAINPRSEGFWGALFVLCVIWGAAYAFFSAVNAPMVMNKKKSKGFFSENGMKWVIVAAVIPIAVMLIGSAISSTFFHAEAYSNIIEVKEAVFEEDMPETDTVTNIALMDSESATIIGNRTLGALSDVVSQFEAGYSYSQINYGGAPVKVTNLEYVDFFKWINNRGSGIPGYIKVDPVNSGAEYIKFREPMKYVESAYFGDDLMRKLRFLYPTKIFDEVTFELDENGDPYYIVSCMNPRISLFGAMDVNEVIIFDPVDGTSEIYGVSETPSWVDNVFTGTLASQKYDWYGMLKNGFWNSVIGNKDCKVTTDDFGYIILGDDVWYFTGVTSISSDESNIGFIISNARTGEYKFYPVIGAEEYSAMSAAEGEVQEKGYVASFPSLINVSGEATYIMVLKDSGGIVKLCALVNVENYSIVATGANQTEAKEEYLKLLKRNGVVEEIPETPTTEETKKVSITVTEVREMTLDGTTVLYITDENGVMYKQKISADESIVLIRVGDKIDVVYTDTEIEKIKQAMSWSYTEG
ncbi:MAG: hypothetical protein E7641_04995 [Ruminococcaceae bacterium]|nr:hypothetical protein [Oscillospiraceae bacterium]